MGKEMMEDRGNRIFSITQLMNKYERILKEHAARTNV
jgi:hypothetical protein